MPTAKDYAKIAEFLSNQDENEVTLSFEKITEIIGESLPETAYRKNQWWENNEQGHPQTKHGWLDEGWRTFDVTIKTQSVSFRKVIRKTSVFEVKAKDATTGKIIDIEKSVNIVIDEENILLVLNDVLCDSIDKNDTITVKVLRKWDSKDLKKAIEYLIDNRGHWIE